MARKKDIFTYTNVGIIEKPNQVDSNILDELMKKFQSAKRFLRERIFDGLDRKSAVNLAKPFFLQNVRYMRDAFLEAEASISSQKELLPTYVVQLEQNIEKLLKKLTKLEQQKCKSEQVKQKIKYTQSRISKLSKKKRYFQYHIDNETVPKIVDGSKQKLTLLYHNKISKEEWRDLRSNALYSRGEKSKGGNENTKLRYIDGNLFELSVLNPMSSTRNDRLTFNVRFPEKFVLTIASYLATGEAYSIRIKRRNGTYEVHLTLEEKITTTPSFKNGVAGIDINPNNLSVTIIYPNGNFRASKVFWMNTVNTVRSKERDWIIQQTLYEAIQWIKSFDIDTLVIEDLKFLQSSGSKSFNRMSSNFSYSNIIKSLLSVTFKESVALLQVEPYYSSFIGKIKYKETYGLSIHQSAAFVLARRGIGFKEKVPKVILSVLFTKEVEKGQEVSDLFKHWKEVKKWYDATFKKMKLLNLYSCIKNCSLEEYLISDLVIKKKIDFPF